MAPDWRTPGPWISEVRNAIDGNGDLIKAAIGLLDALTTTGPPDGIFLPRETLNEWAEYELTDAHLAALRRALVHSSLPEVIATIAHAVKDGDQ